MLNKKFVGNLTIVLTLALTTSIFFFSTKVEARGVKKSKISMFSENPEIDRLNYKLPSGCRKIKPINDYAVEISCRNARSGNALRKLAFKAPDVRIGSANFIEHRKGKCPYIVFQKSFNELDEKEYTTYSGKNKCNLK